MFSCHKQLALLSPTYCSQPVDGARSFNTSADIFHLLFRKNKKIRVWTQIFPLCYVFLSLWFQQTSALPYCSNLHHPVVLINCESLSQQCLWKLPIGGAGVCFTLSSPLRIFTKPHVPRPTVGGTSVCVSPVQVCHSHVFYGRL